MIILRSGFVACGLLAIAAISNDIRVAAATSFCAQERQFIRELERAYGETVVARWKDDSGDRLLSVNTETRAWTLSNVGSDGHACTMRHGVGYWVVGFDEGEPA